MKPFAYLFEILKIKLYHLSPNVVPESFEVVLIQSETTLLNTISGWMNKSPQDIQIKGVGLKELVKNFYSVSFCHSSFQEFVQNFPPQQISIVHVSEKFLIVKKFHVIYFVSFMTVI